MTGSARPGTRARGGSPAAVERRLELLRLCRRREEGSAAAVIVSALEAARRAREALASLPASAPRGPSPGAAESAALLGREALAAAVAAEAAERRLTTAIRADDDLAQARAAHARARRARERAEEAWTGWRRSRSAAAEEALEREADDRGASPEARG